MAQSDTATLILKVNGEDADKKMKKLQSELETLNKQKEDLEKKHRGGKMWSQKDMEMSAALRKDISSLNRQLNNTKSTSQQVIATLENLSKASPKELHKTLKFLQGDLEKVARGSQDWKDIQQKIIAVKKEIQAVQDEQKEAMSMSDKFAEWGQKWMGIAEVVETTAETLSGIKMQAAEAVQAFLDMDEAQVAVKKYTGLSTEAIRELNETFKKMDTRTPREKLNALAADAGRLGITSKDAIIDFVDAANMINVALGEDLGEDAVKNIGKLAQLFGDDKKMGLKQAMISTGSVINDLAQTSSANEGYIMEFTARMAGMGRQANISQAKIMALASVMDQAMVNAEEGSTALSRVLQAIYNEPAKVAKAVGLDIKDFSDLVKVNANEALMKFAEAVRNLGGMDKISPILNELSLSGAGVTKVIATLATQVDKVRATQEQAGEAFYEGTSVINEYNTANNSASAQVEKNKKKVQDLRIELGEKLQPIMAAGLSTSTQLIKISTILLDFGAKHIASIIALTTTIAVFTATMNAAVISEKAHALWTGICTKAQTLWAAKTVLGNLAMTLFTKGIKAANTQFKALNATMKANVIGLLTAGISVAVVALIEFMNKEDAAVNKHKESMSALERINSNATESSQSEITRIKKLTEIINSNAYSYNTKREALLALQKLVPNVHGAISKEISLTREDTAAIGDYIEQLGNKAKAQAYYEELVEQEKKLSKAKRKEEQEKRASEDIQHDLNTNDKLKSDWGDVYGNMNTSIGGMSYKIGEGERNIDRIKREDDLKKQKETAEAAKKEREAIEAEIHFLNDQKNSNTQVKEFFDSLIIKGTSSIPTVNGGGLGELPDKELKSAIDKLKAAAEQKKLVKRMEYESGLIDAEAYSRSILQIDVELYAAEKKLYTKDSAEWLAAENHRLDALKNMKENAKDYSLKQIEVESKEEEQLLFQKYASGLMKEEEYQEKLTQLKLKHLKRRAVFLLANDPGSDDQQQAQTEYQQALAEDQLKRKEEFLRKAADFEKEYNKKTNAERKADEIKLLDEMLKQGIITAEQYKEYLEQINQKYSNLSGPNDPMTSSVISLGEAIANLQQNLDKGQASWQDYAAVAVASLGMISALANSASQLMQANIDVETAKINKRYDAEINAAGRNSKKAKKLEEKRQAEIAKVKNKYASKAMAMQMASAVAQTAISAINAYSSAAAIPLIGHIIAPIAAATAIAAGMIQIATIKKQHQAQMAGYYHGGFTGGHDYTKEAGVVHEGEWVANHKTLANPNVLPIIEMLDFAQRNNTVASLTPADVSRTVTAPQQTATVLAGQSPVIVHETESTTAAINKLSGLLEDGIHADVVLDGPNGLDRQYKKYKNLKNR